MRWNKTKRKAKINLIHLNIFLWLFSRCFDSASTVGVCVIGEHIQAALNISSDLYSKPMCHTPYLCLALHEYVTVIHTSLNILNTIRSQVKTIQSRSQFYFYYILFNIYWKCSSFPRTQWNFMLLNWFSHLCKCTETPSDWIYVKFINNIFIKGLYSISFEFWIFLMTI